MNKIVLSTLMLIIAFGLNARQITEQEALSKAAKFGKSIEKEATLNSNAKKRSKTLTLKYVEKSLDNNLYYVFNQGENQGFVIVSGDDRANEILGYADEGSFDINNLPENMKSWLEVYSYELKQLAKTTDVNTEKAVYYDTKEYTAKVSPLLGSLAWNQDSPYNDLCPTLPNKEKAAAGCVAIALSQVMYYHKWPERGEGSHSYTTNTYNFTLSANFDTEYEWGKMTPTYNSNSSSESRSAVAKLVYHVGVAMDMDYAESSGAITRESAKILSTYFKYDKGMQALTRDTYGLTEWINVLKNEINENRVIIYSGQSSGGGHAFVCDGYDENNLFHINWGWGGTSNGYFQITALTPSTQGIGGGSADGFNSMQGAIIGIQKAKSDSKYQYVMTYNDMSAIEGEVAKSKSVNVLVTNLYNFCGHNFVGKIGLGLYQGDNLVKVISEKDVSLNNNYGYSKYNFTVTIPSLVANGDYQIRPLSKANSDTEYTRARYSVGNDLVNWINVKVTATNATYTLPTDIAAILSISNFEATKMYVNRESVVSFNISNSGEEYYNAVKVALINSDNDNVVAYGDDIIIDVEKGATVNMKFGVKYNVAAGSYRLAILDAKDVIIGDPISVTLYPEPEKESFTLTKKISFVDNNNVPKDNIQFSAQIKNNAGYFAGRFTLVIYNADGVYKTTLESDGYTIDKDQTIDVAINGSLDLDNGLYSAELFYRNGASLSRILPYNLNDVYFTLTDPVGGVNGVGAVKAAVYPNPVVDQLNITCEKEIVGIRIFDISGRLVSEQKIAEATSSYSVDMVTFEPGNYFVQIITTEGVDVEQIIKK